MNITLRVLFRPVPEQLPKIFSNIGIDYEERVLPSITNEVLKAVVVRISIFERIVSATLSGLFPRPNLMLMK